MFFNNHFDINLMGTITITTVALVLTGVYEVLSRVVPTSKTWSIIGNVLKALTYVSNLLDNKKIQK